jgi:glucokinase
MDVLRERLNGNIYDPPRIMLSELGHRDVVRGAIMMVLDATTLNPTDAVR